jgi:hypothetical protein
MNRLLAIAVFFTLLATVGMAQNRANIKGKVVDSLNREALEFATVAALDLKDSSLISYTLTTKGGEFSLHNLPADKSLKLVISFIGYRNFRKVFKLEKGEMLDMGSIKLNPKGTNLKEVIVNAEITPIIIKKDTIEFSAEAFKTPPNAVVEELLKRLPGVQVDIDGTITVNGKKVSKLLIDGKEFFVNDPKIATRNLDASLIDKVQVYDDRENDPDHLVPDSKVDKIINLKFKSALKKSTFGKVRAGAGSGDRFDGGLLYNMFRDTLQISLIGTGFSSQELSSQGGFNRSGNDALYNGSVATGGRSYGGLQTVGSGGVNINTDYGKKLKLNLLYFYSYQSTASSQAQLNQQFLSDTTLSSNYVNSNNSSSRKHSVSGLVEWKPDTINRIRYTPRVSFTSTLSDNVGSNNSSNNFVPRLNSSVSNGNGNGNAFQFQQTFNYYHKVKRNGPSLTVSHNLNISPGSSLNYSNQDLTSYTAFLASSNLHRLADNNNNNTDASLNINYRYPFNKKLTGTVSFNNAYNHNNGRTFTYNQNLTTTGYDIYIDSLSTNLVRDQFTETIKPEIDYQFNKQTRITVGIGLQSMQTDNQFHKNLANINRRELFILPSVQLSVNSFSINYDESVYQPSINNLLPIKTVYSQLYSSAGNPDQLPTRTHSLSLNFSSNKPEKQLSFNVYSTVNWSTNSVFSERTVNSQGASFSKPVNKSGTYYAYMYFYVNKGFKKFNNWQLRLSSQVNLQNSHNFFQVNNSEGFSNTWNGGIKQQAFASWNNKIDINPSYNISPNITTYQNVNYTPVKYVTQTLDVPIVIRWPKHISIEANYTYIYNPLVANGFQRSSNLLNIAVARSIQAKDRGEIRLSCYDLFDQNVSESQYAYGNTVSQVQYQIIKRYFLLSYSYRFSNVVTAKKK